MTAIFLFLDTDMSGGGVIAAGIAIGFFLALVVLAYVIFRLLRKTVKMAFRMAIVAVILAIGAAGSVSLWWFGSGSSGKAKPASTRKK